MSWNHRVMESETDGEVLFTIHEVYYKGEKVVGWTEGGVIPSEETIEELRETLERMLLSLDEPV